MNNENQLTSDEQRLRALMEADSGSPAPLRMESMRRSILAQVPEAQRSLGWRWFPSLLGAGALAVLAVLILVHRGPELHPQRPPLEQIGEVVSDDARLKDIVELLTAFTAEDGVGDLDSARTDLLGLDPLAWNGDDGNDFALL